MANSGKESDAPVEFSHVNSACRPGFSLARVRLFNCRDALFERGQAGESAHVLWSQDRREEGENVTKEERRAERAALAEWQLQCRIFWGLLAAGIGALYLIVRVVHWMWETPMGGK